MHSISFQTVKQNNLATLEWQTKRPIKQGSRLQLAQNIEVSLLDELAALGCIQYDTVRVTIVREYEQRVTSDERQQVIAQR